MRGYQSDSPNIFETPCHTSPVDMKSNSSDEYDFMKNYAGSEQNDGDEEVESDVYFTESEDDDDDDDDFENELKTEI